MSTARTAAFVGAPALAALAAAAAGAVLHGGETSGAVEYGLALLAAICTIGLALATRPAWPLSIGLGLAIFSGHWDTMGIPVAFDRALLLSGVVSALVRARVRDPDALRTRPVDWLLVVVATYALLSALFAGTLGEVEARFALIDRFSLLGFALFFAAPRAFATERDRRILLGTLIAVGGYLGLTALFETLGPSALVVPDYIEDPFVGTHLDRARGPFAEAAANGMMLFSCGVAAAIAATTWRGSPWRTVAGAVLVLCALGVLLTVTRAAWIACGAGSVLALLSVRETRRYALVAVAGGALGVVAAFAVVPNLQTRAEERADDQYPLWDRRNSNAAAIRMIGERPVVGFGWGRFARESEEYYRQSPDIPLTFVRNVHNLYLSNAVELGLLGALLWLAGVLAAIIGALLRRGPPSLRPWKVGLVALGLGYAVVAVSSPLAFAAPTLLLWTWAGVLWGEDSSR